MLKEEFSDSSPYTPPEERIARPKISFDTSLEI